MKLTPENLAYWYLRLNGFLTITNFVVHPDRGRDQRTDVDVLGIRFPYREELVEDTVIDDPAIAPNLGKPYLILAEVTAGRCKLNGPWTRESDGNMQRVLRAVGVVPLNQIEQVARKLYKQGVADESQIRVSLACLGRERDPALRLGAVPQIIWAEVLSFISDRFKRYRKIKRSVTRNGTMWEEVSGTRPSGVGHHTNFNV